MPSNHFGCIVFGNSFSRGVVTHQVNTLTHTQAQTPNSRTHTQENLPIELCHIQFPFDSTFKVLSYLFIEIDFNRQLLPVILN